MTVAENTKLKIERYFTKDIAVGKVYDSVPWERRDVAILNQSAKLIATEQLGVEVPKFWSNRALTVVVDKYFRGQYGTPERETSIWQMINRIVKTIDENGQKLGYFSDEVSRANFKDELQWLLVNQHLCFNSPVWFNVGWDPNPQCSACFLLDVEDNMESILEHGATEVDVFRSGSGTGVNLSKLRGKLEPLSRGGVSSGLLSFNRAYDNYAAVIQSGGKTRRAARMVVCDADHPEILDFIRCKAVEEEKAWALKKAGFDVSFGSDVVELLQFQNANNTIRLTDEFMELATNPTDVADWWTYYRTSKERASEHRATDILDEICTAAWRCGDPGLMFEGTIAKYHTCPSCGEILTPNPCAEFLHNINTSCNLLTLPLTRYAFSGKQQFNAIKFKHAVRIAVIAQDILISFAGYPRERIKQETLKHRPIGLNFADLGALFVTWGLPYDSNEARLTAASISGLMTAYAAQATAELAKHLGSFECYDKNKQAYLDVMALHTSNAYALQRMHPTFDLAALNCQEWDRAIFDIEMHGARNSQLTLLAPNGTVGFFLDCDSTSVEPLISFVSKKSLVGGGTLMMVTQCTEQGLKTLGYAKEDIELIGKAIADGVAPENISAIKPQHLPVFDTAFAQGSRSLSVEAHIDMMAACQPFLSGAISKTVNLPESATPQDLRKAYIRAWKSGVKCITIYRDNSKAVQPVTSSSVKSDSEQEFSLVANRRRRLPAERNSLTHKFSVNSFEGYVHVGLYEDGTPGEIFITMSKEGGLLSGLIDAFATSMSLNLQYGVPLGVLVSKFTNMHFEPYGFTDNSDIPQARSIVDYLFRWLEKKFLKEASTPPVGIESGTILHNVCPSCGGMLRQTKPSCYECQRCSSAYGGCGS